MWRLNYLIQEAKWDEQLSETRSSTYTSCLTFPWARIADIAIGSEILRCLGSLRLNLWGALYVARGRRYRGRLSYLASSKNKIEMPLLQDPVRSDWKVIEDDIVLLWASQTSHGAEGPSTLDTTTGRTGRGSMRLPNAPPGSIQCD
jgi:hypothetical protein